MVTPETWGLFTLYRHYKNGVLLQSGGLMNQPAKYLQSMDFLAEALNDGPN